MTPSTPEQPSIAPGLIEQACQLISELRTMLRIHVPDEDAYEPSEWDTISEAMDFIQRYRQS